MRMEGVRELGSGRKVPDEDVATAHPGSNPGAQDHPSTQPRPRRIITTRECSAAHGAQGLGPQTCQGGNYNPSAQMRKLRPRVPDRPTEPWVPPGELEHREDAWYSQAHY